MAVSTIAGKTIGFALEYSLGHVTHAQNLKATVARGRSVDPVYVELDYHDQSQAWQRLPGVRSNWSLRASLGAYRGLRPHARRLQAALFHTQVTSLLSAGLMRRIPSLISLDATPEQYDALGAHYGHAVGKGKLEEFKKRMNCRAFAAARHLITWSEWAKGSLVRDYGVPSDKVTVIPPGIDTETWDFAAERSARHRQGGGREVCFLFVGGDFARKGGDTLLEAFAQLPAGLPARLSIVTKSDIGKQAEEISRRTGRAITVWNGLKPNSPELRQRFAEADVFVFPSLADCLPLAVMEALSAGLPVITTHVGALSEAVEDGVCGRVVPAENASALTQVIAAVAGDPEGCRRMGGRAREVAKERFDATRNYRRLVSLVEGVAE
ncbi:MAG: glycosyltransferase family 4 protein [Capsulimonadales bacterium]|nr:glycosyltransferase family 4 protein [Capsulimonadales bacterium]